MEYNFSLEYDARGMCSAVPVQFCTRLQAHEPSIYPSLAAVNAISDLASKINIPSPMTINPQTSPNYDIKGRDSCATATSMGQYYFSGNNFVDGHGNLNAGNSFMLPPSSSSSFVNGGGADNMGSSAFMYNHNYHQMHYHYHHHQHNDSNVLPFTQPNSTNFNYGIWPSTVDFYDELARLGTVGFSPQINSTEFSTAATAAAVAASQMPQHPHATTNNTNVKGVENSTSMSITSNRNCWPPLSPLMMTALPFSIDPNGLGEDFAFRDNYNCPKPVAQIDPSTTISGESSNYKPAVSAAIDEMPHVRAYGTTRNNENSDVEDVMMDEIMTETERSRSHIFPCTICDRKYCRKSTLRSHMKHHVGQRTFVCQICGKSFSQAANLTAHKRVHTGEKPFKCYICFRPFSQSSSLVTHKRTHTGERPYPCNQCDKAFTDSSTLTKHLRTHTGHKPYSCHLCLMQFSQSGNLHRHMKTHTANPI